MTSPYLNPPKQPRSRRTLERIVNAALELLEAGGPEAVTVQAVVARAKSSVGSFYARFGGKDDLLDYLGERMWQEALARWDRAVEERTWSNLELDQVTSGAVRLLIEVRDAGAGRLRQLDRLADRADAYDRFRRHLVASLGGLLLERREEMVHPEPELGVRLGLTAVAGLIDARLDGPDGSVAEGSLDRDRLAMECGDLLLRYLTAGGARQATEPVDFFDVWE